MKPAVESDDLQSSNNLKRIDELETFKKEFEKDFHTKIANAIKESRLVEAEIKCIAWATIREKIVWVILGGASIIFIDLIMRAIPSIFAFFAPH